MNSRRRAWFETLGDLFWLRPALIVLACLGLGQLAVWLETARIAGHDVASHATNWGYSGGADGARALLSAVASSTIGVAGTTFSITIAALSLASGQMGPRLLRDFIRDARNQVALGIFLGTFAYALIVLRTVRSVQETAFVPHVGVTGAIVLALLCVATLVWFVHHIATSVDVETVIDAVHQDLVASVRHSTLDAPGSPVPETVPVSSAVTVARSGYLQALDADGLADWAAASGVIVRLRIRPGDYVPIGLPVAHVSPHVDGVEDAVARALTFGKRPAALPELELFVGQLADIGVRALSAGIKPVAAGSVIDHLGDVLCRLAPRHLPTGVIARAGRVVLIHPATDYDALCDAMFDMIRQNAAGSVFVFGRLLDVLARVAEVERSHQRARALRRHADLVIAAARRVVVERADLDDVERRYRRFEAELHHSLSTRALPALRSASRLIFVSCG